MTATRKTRFLTWVALVGLVTAFGCYDHMNELDGHSKDPALDPDSGTKAQALDIYRPVDELGQANKCASIDYSYEMQQQGIVGITGTKATNAFALFSDGTVYAYSGTQWDIRPYEKQVIADSGTAVLFYAGLDISPDGNQLFLSGGSYCPHVSCDQNWAFIQMIMLGNCLGDCHDDTLLSYFGDREGFQGRVIWFAAKIGSFYEDDAVAGGYGFKNTGTSLGNENPLAYGYTVAGCYNAECISENTSNSPLVDAWGSSPANFYVVGNRIAKGEMCNELTGEIYHCDRSQCLLEATVAGTYLSAIGGESDNELFVVGGIPPTDTSPGKSVVLARSDNVWHQMEVNADVVLNGVWGKPENLFVVGGAHTNYHDTVTSIALRYDGNTWTELDVGAKAPLYAVWGSSPSDVHMGGEEGFFHYPDDLVAETEPQSSRVDDTSVADMCQDYCTMEANCIPFCLCEDAEGACTCIDAQDECKKNCPEWIGRRMLEAECASGFRDFISCITTATCDEVEAFFRAHPDDLSDADPCASEYRAMDCDDFEPRTEYGFQSS
jgi:hypothetical protein